MQRYEETLSHAARRPPAPPWLLWLWHALRAEGQAWRRVLTHPRLWLLLGLLALGLLLAVHLPLTYSIDVGIEEGYGGDLPHLRGFNTAENDEHGTYRWTADQAQVRMPGLGQRPVTLQLDFFPVSAQVIELGPEYIELWLAGEQFAVLPVRREGAHYRMRVPPDLLPGGRLELTIRTHTFVPPDPDDPRALGTPLDRVMVTTPGRLWPTAPDWGALLLWLGALVVGWATVQRSLHALPRPDWWALVLLAPLVPLIIIAAVLDPPRWAFGAQPALLAAALAYGLALLLRPALTALAARLDIPLTPRTLGWLLLIIVLAFGLRYGGRLYPRSMHGDIGFHTNRFNEVTQGHVFLLSRNRGVDFPYPPGPYVVLAPLTLTGADPPLLLQLGAALVEALSAALVFAIVARTGKACDDWRRRTLPAAMRRARPPPYLGTALLAAAIYVFTAAGFMTTWWSFDTHIYTQFATLLLLCALVLFGLSVYSSAGVPPPRPWLYRWVVVLGVLVALVCLGHFGFFINTALLGGLALLLLTLLAWRGAAWAGTLAWALLLAGGVSIIAALALFYSYYIPLFVQQAQAAATGGLTGLADRAPVERSYLWRVLWDAGFIKHFGFFPLLLAPLGLGLLARWGKPARLTVGLMLGSLLVSSVFAILPFITLSTQSTRWLMFSAWVVAVGGAVAAQWIWRQGRAGRLATLAMGGFVLWNTIYFWLAPMLWRVRPPEPF
jgi:hypothetical protein